MSYEVINTLKGPSVVRTDGVGTYTITLANLSANSTQESVGSAAIKRILWSTNGNITIARDSSNMVTLYNSGEMKLSELNYSMANTATGNIVVTITSGGSCILQVSKTATYSPVL
jgi:hypothetical protein